MSLQERILKLKRDRNALILAHYYEDAEIQDIADHVGDSLQLAQLGQSSTAPVVLVAGVVFMGESVKILSPEKAVLIPDPQAGCSLVQHCPENEFRTWRNQYPNAIAVTYVNSSASVKAMSDVIVTSSNAEKIIRSIPENRTILFAPDRNLGSWLVKVTGRPMHLWNGACEVHIQFSETQVLEAKKLHPRAMVLAHPECNEGVLRLADVVGSTSRLLLEVQQNTIQKEFIVATEIGIFNQMQKFRPDAILIQAGTQSCGCAICPYMKLNTLEKIEHALLTLQPQVSVEKEVARRARIALDRMMRISNGETVDWPAATDHDLCL